LKLIFAGTPEFAALALDALLPRHEVALVLSRTDKPSGRGQQWMPSPVKERALRAGIPVLQPRTLKPGLRLEDDLATLREVRADLMIVAAYGLILPPDVLSIPRLGCLNIHASLLPRWRGAAPIQRAIEAGDAQTGITIMQMDQGLDTGAMRLIRPLAVLAQDTAASLHDRLAALGADCIVEALDLLQSGQLGSQPQPEQGVCFAQKIEKSESALAWSQSAQTLARKIRALDPFPGCVTQFKGAPIKVWGAALVDAATPVDAATLVDAATYADAPTALLNGQSAGRVVAMEADGPIVQTGAGLLKLLVLQKPGGKRLEARAFLAGTPIQTGDVFL
jgi:methionyl-tRNA formyltransferase